MGAGSAINVYNYCIQLCTENFEVEGCKRFVSIPSGILVVLDDEDQVKGVIGQRQMLKAIGNGVDVTETTCKEVMEMDTSTMKRTIIIEHAISASDPEHKSESRKTAQQTIIINGEEKKQDDLESLPPEIQEILRKHGVEIED